MIVYSICVNKPWASDKVEKVMIFILTKHLANGKQNLQNLKN